MWMDAAACAGHEPTWWVPESELGWSRRRRTAETVKAKQICAGCPVAAECLEFAIDLGLDDGIFGGLDPDERRRLTSRAVCPSGGHAKAAR